MFPLLCLQGDEERKYRSGFGHGREKTEELIRGFSGPRPDGKRWGGASQLGSKNFILIFHRKALDVFLVFWRLRSFLFIGKRQEVGAECQPVGIDCGEPAVQIWKGNI